jgi:hypothetical protein
MIIGHAWFANPLFLTSSAWSKVEVRVRGAVYAHKFNHM